MGRRAEHRTPASVEEWRELITFSISPSSLLLRSLDLRFKYKSVCLKNFHQHSTAQNAILQNPVSVKNGEQRRRKTFISQRHRPRHLRITSLFHPPARGLRPSRLLIFIPSTSSTPRKKKEISHYANSSLNCSYKIREVKKEVNMNPAHRQHETRNPRPRRERANSRTRL